MWLSHRARHQKTRRQTCWRTFRGWWPQERSTCKESFYLLWCRTAPGWEIFQTAVLIQLDSTRSCRPYLDHSGQSEVGHLAGVVLSHQDVSSRQISVNAVLLFQVWHPISHLGTHVNEWRNVLILPLWTWNKNSPQQLESIGANSSTKKILQNWKTEKTLRSTSEEVEQAAFLHQLRNDPVRSGGRADGKQRDQVTMAETLQDLNFPLKFTVVQLRVWERRRGRNEKEEQGPKPTGEEDAPRRKPRQHFEMLTNFDSNKGKTAVLSKRVKG